MDNILISVVSVSYNCIDNVDKTLNSLLSQTYQDYELIIVDGKSSDGTTEKIKEYESKFKHLKIISERDDGIYDAMNKGARLALGKYVYFLNFADIFYDDKVLETIANRMNSNKDFYYGDADMYGEIRNYEDKFNLFNFIYLEGMVCHQSIFTRRELLLKYPFDLSHRLCADRDFLIKALKDKCTSEYVNIVICTYDTKGLSAKALKELDEDSDSVSFKHGGLKARIFIYIYKKINELKK